MAGDTGDRQAQPATQGLRVLALSGGGFLGLYTATVLAALEAEAGEPLARRFDLVAGTSIGGVLALALAFELPMAGIADLFVRHGPAVFSPRPLPQRALARLVDLTRSIGGPKSWPAWTRPSPTPTCRPTWRSMRARSCSGCGACPSPVANRRCCALMWSG